MDSIIILMDSAQGIYIPHGFCRDFDPKIWNLDPESWAVETCLAGIDAEDYWEAWDYILNKAFCIIGNREYTLFKDGDLFAIAYDYMSEQERLNFFGGF